MNNNILTLEQIQKMSIDEVINMYKCGYTMSGTTEILTQTNSVPMTNIGHTYPVTETSQTLPILHTNANYIYPMANTDSHYTAYDIGVIAAAIGISVGVLAIVIRYMIRKEEERIINEIKLAISSATQKAGLIERLIPMAEKLGQKLFSPKSS